MERTSTPGLVRVAVNPLNPASSPASFFPLPSTSQDLDLHLPQHPITISFPGHVECKAPFFSVGGTANPQTSIDSPRQKHSPRSTQQHNKARTNFPTAETRRDTATTRLSSPGIPRRCQPKLRSFAKYPSLPCLSPRRPSWRPQRNPPGGETPGQLRASCAAPT